MTESKMPSNAEKVSEPNAKVTSGKDASKKGTAKNENVKPDNDSKKSSPKASSNKAPKQKISKIAVLALIIAVTIPAAHYYWQKLEDKKLTQSFTQKLNKENSASIKLQKNQIDQALRKQQAAFSKQLQQMEAKINNASQTKITELDKTVQHLEQSIKQRQPSDWLIHEAEYLIRIAGRTLWLEHDANAASLLLSNADARLSELQDPAFFPVRELIHQDITTLKSMPNLETDDVILALLAMSKQVDQLPLAVEELEKIETDETNSELSNNISDWQANLNKTWQKFLNDFIRVRQKSGNIEPLISPSQQENLKQNLSLKIQLALWATSERKGDIYLQALMDIQQWLTSYFDMENNINKHFLSTLSNLQKKQIDFDYTSELASLKAIRTTIRNQKSQPLNIEIKKEVKKNKPKQQNLKVIKEKSTQVVKKAVEESKVVTVKPKAIKTPEIKAENAIKKEKVEEIESKAKSIVKPDAQKAEEIDLKNDNSKSEGSI